MPSLTNADSTKRSQSWSGDSGAVATGGPVQSRRAERGSSRPTWLSGYGSVPTTEALAELNQRAKKRDILRTNDSFQAWVDSRRSALPVKAPSEPMPTGSETRSPTTGEAVTTALNSLLGWTRTSSPPPLTHGDDEDEDEGQGQEDQEEEEEAAEETSSKPGSSVTNNAGGVQREALTHFPNYSQVNQASSGHGPVY